LVAAVQFGCLTVFAFIIRNTFMFSFSVGLKIGRLGFEVSLALWPKVCLQSSLFFSDAGKVI
jgi:hypothetical protein